MELTPEVVPKLVARLFRPADQAPALTLLGGYGQEPHERERTRVLVAVLKLSGGLLGELERMIAHARQDYRDVLAWAEFPEEMRRPCWHLPADEVARIRAGDRKQYLTWLSVHTTDETA